MIEEVELRTINLEDSNESIIEDATDLDLEQVYIKELLSIIEEDEFGRENTIDKIVDCFRKSNNRYIYNKPDWKKVVIAQTG